MAIWSIRKSFYNYADFAFKPYLDYLSILHDSVSLLEYKIYFIMTTDKRTEKIVELEDDSRVSRRWSTWNSPKERSKKSCENW